MEKPADFTPWRAVAEARARALLTEREDTLRCGHPKGASRCTRAMLCGTCPYAETLEYDLAA